MSTPTTDNDATRQGDQTPDPRACDHYVGWRSLTGGERQAVDLDRVVTASEAAGGVPVHKWAKFCSECGARLREGKAVD